MKRTLFLAIPLLALVALLAWWFRPPAKPLASAFVSDRNLTLFSSLAQVRTPLATLHYGDSVAVLRRRNENVQVRTKDKLTGWVDGSRLMPPDLWLKCARLLEQARALPLQSPGRTKVKTNLRSEPGRSSPRLYQFSRGVPLEVVGRAVADWVQAADEKDSPDASQESRKEDWFLVRGFSSSAPGEAAIRPDAPGVQSLSEEPVPVAGWVVARFIELDLPGAVRVQTLASELRPLAWFELNRVPDPSGDKPQYLVAGARGPEGQPCDITAFRVFTWNVKRSRYETAFLDNQLCGSLPIRVGKGPRGEPEFRFNAMSVKKEEYVFRLEQTIVRRIRNAPPLPSSPLLPPAH